MLGYRESQKEGHGKLSLFLKTSFIYMATLELKGFSLCTSTAISEPGESVLKLERGHKVFTQAPTSTSSFSDSNT